MKRRLWRQPGAGLSLVLICLVSSAVSGSAVALDPPAAADDDPVADRARICSAEQGLMLTRAESGTTDEVAPKQGVDLPIFSGDAVATGSDQRVELRLAGGARVRLDHGSRLSFSRDSSPRPEARPLTLLQLAEGTLCLEAATDPRDEFRVGTPACTIHVRGDADLRIEVRGGRTRVCSRRGAAEVHAGGGSLILPAGMTTEIVPGEKPRDPRPSNTFVADEFDRWVSERNEDRDTTAVDAHPRRTSAGSARNPAKATPLNPSMKFPLGINDQGGTTSRGSDPRMDMYRHAAQPRQTRAPFTPALGPERDGGEGDGPATDAKEEDGAE